jgi:hypothetical protein
MRMCHLPDRGALKPDAEMEARGTESVAVPEASGPCRSAGTNRRGRYRCRRHSLSRARTATAVTAGRSPGSPSLGRRGARMVAPASGNQLTYQGRTCRFDRTRSHQALAIRNIVSNRQRNRPLTRPSAALTSVHPAFFTQRTLKLSGPGSPGPFFEIARLRWRCWLQWHFRTRWQLASARRAEGIAKLTWVAARTGIARG